MAQRRLRRLVAACPLCATCLLSTSCGATPTTAPPTTAPPTTAPPTTATSLAPVSAPVDSLVDTQVDAQVGQGILFFNTDEPDVDGIFLGGIVVEPTPGLVSKSSGARVDHIARLDQQGSRLVISLNSTQGPCFQIAQVSIELTETTAKLSVQAGSFDDHPQGLGCENGPAGASIVFVDVPGGIGSRTIDVTDCVPADPSCGAADGLTLEEIPLVRSVLVGCVPPQFMAHYTHDRLLDLITICDEETLAEDYLGMIEHPGT